MPNVCVITQKRTRTGNNVSHSQRKTKRKFIPNMQSASFYSSILQNIIRLNKVTTRGMNIIMRYPDGIDGYLSSFKKPNDLPTKLRILWKKIYKLKNK